MASVDGILPLSVSACPAVCTQQVYISITALGIILLIFTIIFFFFKKLLPKILRRIILVVLVVSIIFTLFSIDSTGCGGGCSKDSVNFSGFILIPEFWEATLPGFIIF